MYYARAANHLPTLNCEMVLAIGIVPLLSRINKYPTAIKLAASKRRHN